MADELRPKWAQGETFTAQVAVTLDRIATRIAILEQYPLVTEKLSSSAQTLTYQIQQVEVDLRHLQGDITWLRNRVSVLCNEDEGISPSLDRLHLAQDALEKRIIAAEAKINQELRKKAAQNVIFAVIAGIAIGALFFNLK